MSKGTPKHFVRFSDELLKLVWETIHRRNEWSDQEPWTLSDFLRVAINEKIAKMARSRRRRGGCLTPLAREGQSDEIRGDRAITDEHN